MLGTVNAQGMVAPCADVRARSNEHLETMEVHKADLTDYVDMPQAWKTARVLEVLGIGRTKLWQLAKSGALKGPVRTDYGTRWDSREVLAYLRSQLEKGKAVRDQSEKELV